MLACAVATRSLLLRVPLAGLVLILGALAAAPGAHANAAACGPHGVYSVDGSWQSCTYAATLDVGISGTFTMPAGYDEVSLRLIGGRGGNATYQAACFDYRGGAGGLVTGSTPLSPGDVLTVSVGGSGESVCAPSGGPGGVGGSGGGANGGSGQWPGAGGGGATRVSTSSGLIALAAGGGGAAPFEGGGAAGQRGGGSATNFANANGGEPGTLTAGGAGGTTLARNTTPGAPGTFGAGGAGGARNFGGGGGGGGGAGYYGGGGGGPSQNGGGGGGGGANYAALSDASLGIAGSDSPSVVVRWQLPRAAFSAGVRNAGTNADWGSAQAGGSAAYGVATVQERSGRGVPTGSVSFAFFSGSTCSGSPTATSTGTLDGSGLARSDASASLAPGTYSYRATYTGDSAYGESSACTSLTVSKYTQTIAFTTDPPAGAHYNGFYAPQVGTTTSGPAPYPSINISVAGESGGVCQYSGGEVFFFALGTCTLVASAGGNASYEPAETVRQSITVGKKPIRIDADPLTIGYGQSDSGQPVTWRLRASDLRWNETPMTMGITGAPECSIAPHGSAVGTYDGVISCAPGTLSAPLHQFVTGSSAALTVAILPGQTQSRLTPASTDLGVLTVDETKTVELTYAVDGVDMPSIESSIDASGADVEVVGLPSSAAGGSSTTFQVRVTPRASGPISVTLSITDASVDQQSATLTGFAERSHDHGNAFTRTALATLPVDLTQVAVDTLDRDPYPDVIVASASSGRVFTLQGRGNGSFVNPVELSGHPDPGPLGLATGDLDGDADLDITTGSRIFRNTGDGTFAPGVDTGLTGNDVGAADVNADGRQDLILTTDDAVLVSRGDGAGGFATPTSFAVPKASGLLVADVDRDGDTDIATSSNDANAITLLRNDGQGGFAPEALEVGRTSEAIGIGDLNGDGRRDLSTGDRYLPGNAGGSFGPVQETGGTSREALLITDFDGDKRDDQLTARHDDSDTILRRGNGQGGFADADIYVGDDSTTEPWPADLAAGDFNRDGRMDALVVRGTPYLSQMFNGRGTPNSDRLAAKITEARFGNDPYMKVVNTRRDAPIRLDGWRVEFGNGLRVTLPLSMPVPPGGSVFIGAPVNTGGSLGSYVRSDLGMPPGIVGVRLDGVDSTPSDAVGYSADYPQYREGSPTPERTFIGQGAYLRRSVAGRPVDTDDNAADFVAVDTRADEGTGTILGAPRPDRWDGPTNRNDVLQSSLVDPTKAATAAPNRVVSGGYMTINRTVTNCSGGLTGGVCANADASAAAVGITKLRFRVTALSTYGNSDAALLRLVGSDDASYGALGVRGLPLDGPSPVTGGGLNASQVATQLLPSGGLMPGQSINVAFRFKVDRGGAYTFGYDTEDDVIALPKASAPPAAEESVPEAPPVPDAVKGSLPQSAATSTPAPGTVTPPASTPKPAPTPTPKPSAKKQKCVTRKQFKKLRGQARKRAKICAPAKKRAPAKTTPAATRRPAA